MSHIYFFLSSPPLPGAAPWILIPAGKGEDSKLGKLGELGQPQCWDPKNSPPQKLDFWDFPGKILWDFGEIQEFWGSHFVHGL